MSTLRTSFEFARAAVGSSISTHLRPNAVARAIAYGLALAARQSSTRWLRS